MKLEEREDYKWAKYRWEFLRRNSKEMGKVTKAMKREGIQLGEFLLGPSANKAPNALALPPIDRVKSDEFWSPELSFDELIDKIREKDPGLIGNILAYALVEPSSVKFDWDKAKLKIEIDLDEVYSVESLKRMVSKNIESFYSVAVKLKYVTPKKRPNMADFDVILKVGDMKRQGKKNREIAKTIHPRKYAENPESAIRLIGYYFKRYKKLIDEMGCLDMSYP